MNKIVNLTQHPASREQIAAGVVDLQGGTLQELRQLLTFEQLPSGQDVIDRAERIADLALASNASAAMIGGAPFLMLPLDRALERRGIRALFAFSTRVVEEETLPDGGVKKTGVFRHQGFVPAV